MTLGEKLYTLRTKQNMTQEQLAEKLQVSRQSISKWESDATRPDLEKLKFLAEFYQVSLDKLLDEDVDIFSEETSSDLNQNTNCVANNQGNADASANPAFTNGASHYDTFHNDSCSASGVSPETIENIASEILQKNHKTWKRTAIGFSTACLALTVALIVVTVSFSARLNNLSDQIAQKSTPVYVNNDSDYISEQDTYFQNYNATADSVSDDGKNLHVKFTAVLKNYQDNTTLTIQLQNTSDQSNIPITFTCENGTYTGFADLPINTDTYTTTACIDTDGSKQTVTLSEYETLSVLGLTDWQPNVEIVGNQFDNLSRTNFGDLNLSCQQAAFVSNISDAEFQVIYNDTPLYTYSLTPDNLESLAEACAESYIRYNFKVPKDSDADDYIIKFRWYNSFLKQYITYETQNNWTFNTTDSENAVNILFNSDTDIDSSSHPEKITFSTKP